jgi:glucose-1-phosphate cytidylyltransferase
VDLAKYKVVILAGGYGSRLSEETNSVPKPMVEIGGKPILWHIMKIYSSYGLKKFVICLGYKGYIIKDYFRNYYSRNSNFKINLNDETIKFDKKFNEDWEINLVDTGLNTYTGGRIRRIKKYVMDQDFFFMTYGDAVCNVNIKRLANFHILKNKIATLTAVSPPERFGRLEINKNKIITSFIEKPKVNDIFINGGFFCLSKKIFKFLKNDKTIFEEIPLRKISKIKQLVAFVHKKFWQPMDTIYERNKLNLLWNKNKAPWKIW